MKKLIGIGIIVGSLIFGGSAFAKYKDNVKGDVNNELVRFFKMEQSNRLSEYSMKTLIQNIDTIFKKNHIKPTTPEPPIKPEVEDKE